MDAPEAFDLEEGNQMELIRKYPKWATRLLIVMPIFVVIAVAAVLASGLVLFNELLYKHNNAFSSYFFLGETLLFVFFYLQYKAWCVPTSSILLKTLPHSLQTAP